MYGLGYGINGGFRLPRVVRFDGLLVGGILNRGLLSLIIVVGLFVNKHSTGRYNKQKR
jgi:hypothetical protein